MSGSTDYTPSFKSDSSTDCSNVSFTTTLASPNPLVVSGLVIAEILDVNKGADNSLHVYDGNGKLVGALLTTHRNKIIECIDNGFEFIAIVKSINGGNCTVLVRAK